MPQDERMVETLDAVMSCMVITNPLQTGHPVMFATKGFAEAVGYHREELLGRSVFQVLTLYLHATLAEWPSPLIQMLSYSTCRHVLPLQQPAST